jgi:hypothetical protein
MTIRPDRPKKSTTVEVGKEVMISCQATKGCFGRKARIVSAFDIEGHFGYTGRRVRYKCLACNRSFTLRH